MLCCYVGYAQYHRTIICCPYYPECCPILSAFSRSLAGSSLDLAKIRQTWHLVISPLQKGPKGQCGMVLFSRIRWKSGDTVMPWGRMSHTFTMIYFTPQDFRNNCLSIIPGHQAVTAQDPRR
jgi:hypothetical protein